MENYIAAYVIDKQNPNNDKKELTVITRDDWWQAVQNYHKDKEYGVMESFATKDEAQEFCDKYNAHSNAPRLYLVEDYTEKERAGFIGVGTEETTRILAVCDTNICVCELVGYSYEEALSICEEYNKGEHKYEMFERYGKTPNSKYELKVEDFDEDNRKFIEIEHETYSDYNDVLQAAQAYEDALIGEEQLEITREGVELYRSDYPQNSKEWFQKDAEITVRKSPKLFKSDELTNDKQNITQSATQEKPQTIKKHNDIIER